MTSLKQVTLRKLAASLFCASLLTVSIPADQSHASGCYGTFKVVRVAHWDVLNVRSGPGPDYRVIRALQPGEGCILKSGERRGNWVNIEMGGRYGWVNRKYLAFIQ